MGYEIMRGVEPANLANRLYRLKVALDEILAHTVTEPLTEKPVKEEKPQPKATPAPKKEKPAQRRTEAQDGRDDNKLKEEGTVVCPKKGSHPGDILTFGYCSGRDCYEKGCKAWQA
jgi:hypothetical protein